MTISSTNGKGNGTNDGDINVNGAVSWSKNTLTLNATNNVFVNNVMAATGTAGLTAAYGSGTNADETPKGLYTALGDSNARIDFSGTGSLKMGAKGSEETYTVINTAAQLTAARSTPSGRYALGSNIDASSITNWTPLDNGNASGFTGRFNGLGHQLDNFKSKAQSIFGTIASGASVGNLSLTSSRVDADSTSAKTSAGILADVNRGSVVNIAIDGMLDITDAENHSTRVTAAGLLAGTNHGLIAQSHAQGSVRGVAGTTGGLIGVNESGGRIVDSWIGTGSILNDTGYATASGYVGGLVGVNNGTVRRAYATNTITLTGAAAPGLRVGGFVGRNAGTIGEAYTSSASIHTSNSAPNFGGFVGENSGVISDAYTTRLGTRGANSSWDAGFAYFNSGTIRNAYATMNVSGDGVNSYGLPRHSFAQQNTGTLENVYWHAEGGEPALSELWLTPGANMLTAAAAKSFASYAFGASRPDIWAASRSGYPILRNTPVSVLSSAVGYGVAISVVVRGLQGGSGTSDDEDSYGRNSPFTTAGGYVDAGVWDASGILTGSPYANIKGVVRVDPRQLTISGVVADRTYSGASDTSATLRRGVANGGLVGLAGSQTLAIAYTSAAFRDGNAGTGKTVDLAYTVADGANGGKLANYTLPATTTANITPKPVDVTITGNDRPYDGTTAATVTGQFSGLITGDDLAIAYAAATFGNRNIGSRTVTVSGLRLAGASASNYTLNGSTSRSTTAAITPRPLQLYGLAEEGSPLQIGAADLKATNVVEGDSVALGGSVGIAASTAGRQPIADFSLLTVNNPNYTVAGSVGSIIVGNASLVLDGVTTGSASVATSGKATTVTQTSDKAVLDWLRLSLGKDETLTFAQPSSSSITLNRVITDIPSVIEGTLKANGRVFVLNASGVLFTVNSRVDVGGLVASAFNLTNDDFIGSNYVFTVVKGNGSVISEGDIVIADGGFAALASKRDVRHTGTTTGGDSALFASTDSLTLTLDGAATDYAIGGLTGATTVNGNVNIGSATRGGRLLTAGDTVAASGLALNTGNKGAWVWEQNGGFTIGEQTRDSVNANLNARDFSLTSRKGDIVIAAAIDWSANTTLELHAANDIFIDKSIKATGANAGFTMRYGGDYHLITPATFSGAVLDANGKPVARQIPAGTEYSSVTLGGANARLTINGDAYTLIRDMGGLAAIGGKTGHFALAGDLDAAAWSAAHKGTSSVVASMSGTLAGLGHAVSNLTLDAPTQSCLGLIGQMAANGGARNILRDIGVLNVDISGGGGIGALAGSATDTAVYQAYSTGRIRARSGTAGGLVGVMLGEGIYDGDRYVLGTAPGVERSYSEVSITSAGNRLGGLVGNATTIVIADSHATGKVAGSGVSRYYVNRETGERVPVLDEYGRPVEMPAGSVGDWYVSLEWSSSVGGLLGGATYANVSKSWASGNVTALDGEQVGGLVGVIAGQWDAKPFPNAVTGSFATGNVIGGFRVGGLVGEVGYLLLDGSHPVVVDNAYATGDVTGTRETDQVLGGGMIGGLIGSAVNSRVSNSHATGNVVTIADGRTNNLGGLVGSQRGGSVSDSYATGTVIGNGGFQTGGLVGGGDGSGSGNWYADARVEAAARPESAAVRSEAGRVAGDAMRREPDEARDSAKDGTDDEAKPRGGRRSRPTLDRYIDSGDGDSYSARVKSVAVEDGNDEEER